MIRNMDTIRSIVLTVRASDEPVSHRHLSDLTQDEFAAHAQLLDEAGLIQAALRGSGKEPAKAAVIWRLTWAGHEFADAVLSDTLWKKAKDDLIKPSASWTFGIFVEYLKFEIRKHLPGLGS